MSSSDDATVTFDHEWTEYQARTLNALQSGDHDLVVLRTGYGGGKSVLGARWIHRTAIRHSSDAEYLVLAPDYSKGGPATYRVFFDELPGEDTIPNDAEGDPENSPIVAGYNANEKRLTYINGAIARLGSADKWNRYAGSEFGGIWCDEPAHYDNTDLYDLHEMLVSRQRVEDAPNVTLWTSTGAGYNQYYDITERQVTPDDEPLPWADRMTVIVGSALDNPFLSEKDKMVAQFADTPREAQALHGGFAAAEGLVYSDFTRELHVIPQRQVAHHVTDGPSIYGYDAGWNDPRVLVQFRPTSYDQWVAVDSFHRSGSTIEDAIGWLQSQNKPEGTIYAEHEPEHIEKFRRAGWDAEKANKNLDEGIPFVRGLLEADESGRPGLLVSDRCTELIQEFLSYQEDEVGTSKADDHQLDATRYALFTHEYDDGGDEPSMFGYTT